MEASEMVDVLHYYFEEDLSVSTAEQQQARSESRSVVYRTLYGKPYKYATPNSGGTSMYSADGSKLPDDGFYSDLSIFDPSEDVKKPVKPFVPATDMDADSPLPFGKVLDAPLN
jgi:hypothetical protein